MFVVNCADLGEGETPIVTVSGSMLMLGSPKNNYSTKIPIVSVI